VLAFVPAAVSLATTIFARRTKAHIALREAMFRCNESVYSKRVSPSGRSLRERSSRPIFELDE
jgi:hypothetical protein